MSKIQSEHRRRGITVSLVFHALILLLGLMPFLVQMDFPPLQERAIQIEFENDASTRSGSSSAAAKVRAARQKVALATMPTKSTNKPVKTAPAPKPVITSPQPDLYVPQPKDTYFEDAIEHQESEGEHIEELAIEEEVIPDHTFENWEISESDETSEEPAPLSDADVNWQPVTLDEFFEGNFSGEGKEGDGDEHVDFLNSEWPGEGNANGEGERDSSGEGEGSRGKDTGHGNEGVGHWGDLAGDGLFNRKVIKRANVGRIAKQNGRIAIELCVDKAGHVKSATHNASLSTITNADLVSKAEKCAMNYVFDQDPNAPEQQCGRLTFVFKIDR